MKAFSDFFDFLYAVSKLKGLQTEILMEKYMKLSELLTHDLANNNYIELKDKFSVLSVTVKPQSSPSEILKFILDYSFVANASVALRILLTLQVTLGNGEGGF